LARRGSGFFFHVKKTTEAAFQPSAFAIVFVLALQAKEREASQLTW
jgi:hypothetical protein